MDRCLECNFVYDEIPIEAVTSELRALPPRYMQALRTADREGLARARPDPTTWSALEYTCHVRDVLWVQRERLLLALQQERPVFTPMRRDERAIEESYNEQDVEVVLDELAGGTKRFAAGLDVLHEAEWARVGVYNWPETAERSMAWLARHTLHEGVHHLLDITRSVEALRGAE